MDDPEQQLGPAVAVCTSCHRLYPDDQRCACIVERAETMARESWDAARLETPRWRRPRAWDALPYPRRQDLTLSALTVVELLEASGWRLVSTRRDGAHTRTEDLTTPPTGLFRVPNVVRLAP